jgi:general secretion pathway protein D
LYEEGLKLREAGKPDEAMSRFRQVLRLHPDHREAAESLKELDKAAAEQAREGLVLTSSAPITLNFRQTDLKQAFEFLARAFGVNVIFDEGVKSVPVTLFAKDVTFEQGLNLLLTTTQSFYKRIGPNTILIAPDTKAKRGQYEDHLVRTFQLNTIPAKEMAAILNALLPIKKLIVNTELNSIVIRDTEEIIKLAERIIEVNDRRPAEMILEVEILEVNRTKADKLGLDFNSYQITAAVPPYSLGGSLRRAAETTGTLTIPSVTLRFFKQDVDAKTLANPKIRVINAKSAKIHIGDRVPLRAATITETTGQVRTTYEYRDIGIRLTAEPVIHLDNTVTVKMNLEVSSLGENLGTAAEPAFRIGTRNAETIMHLRDGETAILGGLIRDEERNTRVKVPGLGQIPAIGALFTSYDDSSGRTDVLLTITPRVVRGWDQPAVAAREFHSGSETVYSRKPVFAALSGQQPVTIRVDAPAAGAAPAAPPAPVPTAAAPAAVPPGGAVPAPVSPAPAIPVLAFSQPVYQTAAGQSIEIVVTGENLKGAGQIPLEVIYNPQLLTYLRAEKGDNAAMLKDVQVQPTPGQIRLNIDTKSAPDSGRVVLARLTMQGSRPGVSYLVYRMPAVQSPTGETINAQLRAARVVIQ